MNRDAESLLSCASDEDIADRLSTGEIHGEHVDRDGDDDADVDSDADGNIGGDFTSSCGRSGRQERTGGLSHAHLWIGLYLIHFHLLQLFLQDNRLSVQNTYQASLLC